MNLKQTKKHRITDSATLIVELNSLLAEEFQAWYQYYIVAPFLHGCDRESVQEFFQEAADDELNDHASKLLNRLNELNQDCTVIPTPDSWKLAATSKFGVAPMDVMSQLSLNVKAEQEAIEHYQKVIVLAEQLQDHTTYDMLKEILADEEQHLSELNDFLKDRSN